MKVGQIASISQSYKPTHLECKLTLAAVDYDERIFQIRSWIESQYKSQDPRDTQDSCQFEYDDDQTSLTGSCHVTLMKEKKIFFQFVLLLIAM